jgi:hypothetical protein
VKRPPWLNQSTTTALIAVSVYNGEAMVGGWARWLAPTLAVTASTPIASAARRGAINLLINRIGLVVVGAASGAAVVSIWLTNSKNVAHAAFVYEVAAVATYGFLVVLTVVIASVRVSLRQHASEAWSWIGFVLGIAGLIDFIIDWMA